MSIMEFRATVDCCSSAWVVQKWHLLTMFGLRVLGFRHGLSFQQPSLADWTEFAHLSHCLCRSTHLHWGSFGLVFAERRIQDHQHVLATLGDEADFGDLALTKTDAASSWPWKVYTIDFVEKLKPKSIRSVPNSSDSLSLTDHSMATKQSKLRKSTTFQSLMYRCFSEAVNVRGKSMQAAKPCPQEEPLKEVLGMLGLPEYQLTDLHNMEAVKWRLVCRVANSFDSFCHDFWGVAVAHLWEETM